MMTKFIITSRPCDAYMRKQTSNNGFSPGRRLAIIRTSSGILLIGTLGTNLSDILSEIHIFSFKDMHLKMSLKWRQFCYGLSVLMPYGGTMPQWVNSPVLVKHFIPLVCWAYLISSYFKTIITTHVAILIGVIHLYDHHTSWNIIVLSYWIKWA